MVSQPRVSSPLQTPQPNCPVASLTLLRSPPALLKAQFSRCREESSAAFTLKVFNADPALSGLSSRAYSEPRLCEMVYFREDDDCSPWMDDL